MSQLKARASPGSPRRGGATPEAGPGSPRRGGAKAGDGGVATPGGVVTASRRALPSRRGGDAAVPGCRSVTRRAVSVLSSPPPMGAPCRVTASLCPCGRGVGAPEQTRAGERTAAF